MKRLFCYICLLVALSFFNKVSAQVVFQQGKLYAGETQLTKENAAQNLPEALANRYTKALTTEKVGSLLALVGGGAALASGALWAASEVKYRHQVSDILPVGIPYGIMGTVLGAAVGAGGLVTYFIGRGQVHLVEKRFNGVSQAELDFGVTPSGVGLALRF